MRLEDHGTPEELAFWEIERVDDAPVLRDEGPPLAYDLEERTTRFGEQIILFARKIPWGPVNNRLIDQVVGAGTSVGANYCEADDGVSRADFKHRISICRKEARETKFFLRMVSDFGAEVETRCTRVVEGSARTAPRFQQNLAQHESVRIMNPHPHLHSSFVIRH